MKNKILKDFEMKADHSFEELKLILVVLDTEKEANKIIDMTFPADHWMKIKVSK